MNEKKIIVLEGRLLCPGLNIKHGYMAPYTKVTQWWSDGSVTEKKEPTDIPIKFFPRVG